MQYTCNICGAVNDCQVYQLGREKPDCRGCGSNVRMRAVIGLLSHELFGARLPIDAFPRDPGIRGVGLSDWDAYAERLGTRLSYTNTYYHQEPLLDITCNPEHQVGSCDFLISTDVFEHVLPPVGLAFTGARQLLKEGGVLILTVPYMVEPADTIEHFPSLHEWALEQDNGGAWRLENKRSDGSLEVFTELVFHGGPGSTLEMRLFSLQSLLDELRKAGFSSVRVAEDPMPEIGVIWSHAWSLPIVARA